MLFKEALTQDEKATCLAIRRVVFIEGQNVPEERERRDEDKACRHFLVMEGNEPIATMRVIVDSDDAKIQRMAVLPSYQGKGVGFKMLNFAMDELTKDKKLTRAILGSQEHAVAFYRRAGFNVISDCLLYTSPSPRDRG